MYTTTGDLCAFWEALFAGRILSPELTMTTLDTHWRFSETAGYGCGLYQRLGGSRFWIAGSDAGVGFESRHLVREGVVVNVLANVSNGEDEIRAVVSRWT